MTITPLRVFVLGAVLAMPLPAQPPTHDRIHALFDAIAQRGVIGLQIHGGPPSEAWYRRITVRELPPE